MCFVFVLICNGLFGLFVQSRDVSPLRLLHYHETRPIRPNSGILAKHQFDKFLKAKRVVKSIPSVSVIHSLSRSFRSKHSHTHTHTRSMSWLTPVFHWKTQHGKGLVVDQTILSKPKSRMRPHAEVILVTQLPSEEKSEMRIHLNSPCLAKWGPPFWFDTCILNFWIIWLAAS